jgi:L-lactate dehydrogenase complex protein LldG
MPFESSKSARHNILHRLRSTPAPFEDAPPRPADYLHVSRAPEGDLAERFKAEVERLSGHVHIVPDAEAGIEKVLELLANIPDVIAWDTLPLPGLTEALAQHNITRHIPHARHESRSETLHAAEPIKVGISGADAGFATTGTIALITRGDQGRLPSLLAPIHIAILPRARLFPRLEDWLHDEGRAALLQSNSVVFVTGPSRTADIEMQTILGVHGPGVVHVVIVG